jgi:endonuclease/exonuclease/phosphatase family metal-dependent hydrolase
MTDKGRIRVATFNIKHGARADEYHGNPKRVAEACESLDVDVLALQEVDQYTIRNRRADLPQLIAKATGLRPVFAPTMNFVFGRYGNALLAHEIEWAEAMPLGGARRFKTHLVGRELQFGYEPRNAIVAGVRIDGRAITVAATHLSTNPRIGQRQLLSIEQALVIQPKPNMLLGDLNLTRAEVTPFLPAAAELAEGLTFPAPSPHKQIDHIAVDGLKISAVEAVRFPEVSDHLALVATVELFD